MDNMIYQEDIIAYINFHTGIHEEIIDAVLNSEMEYLASVGLACINTGGAVAWHPAKGVRKEVEK